MKKNSYNNKKKKIIRLIIITIILLIVLIILLNNIINENEKQNTPVNNYVAQDEKGNLTRIAYTDINTCMNLYVGSIKENTKYFSKDVIYNILSEKYIKEKEINKENVLDFVKTINDANDYSLMYTTLDVKLIQDKEIVSFIVYGILEKSIDCTKYGDIYAIVNINPNDNSFSIEPLYGFESLEEINVDNLETKIIYKVDNSYTSFKKENVDIAENYMNIYKKLALGAPEILYNKLDSDFRNEYFNTLESFEQYIEENKEYIYSLTLEKYLAEEKDNYKQYKCKDVNNNYYIFKEISPIEYRLSIEFAEN